MILDNENEHLKVHEWIEKYTNSGSFSIVTGYFTVGALAFLSKVSQHKIKEYRFVLGDIVNADENYYQYRPLDLLNENISVDAAVHLSKLAKEAVAFLELESVQAKTLEPNFCHAKLYLYQNTEKDPQKDFYISGSSNLTEAGIGKKITNNVELNVANFGSDPQYKELISWFTQLWNRPQAHAYKTIKNSDGKIEQKPFKQYLIDEIKKIFIEYTPKELYYKVLFELFSQDLLKENDNPEFTRQLGRLENTSIYNALFEFQQKGVLSLIKMLNKYNGAVLADAVGLGKTWSALAVMKFYELQGREVILVCPKKLQHNWLKYKKHQNSRFEKDEFEYFMRFHSDMSDGLMEKYKDRADCLFVNTKPKLFVIDESHNLRNDKSKRYKFLVENILAKNEDVKVLMLSATPINNSLMDIRNQFKLIVAGRNNGFRETLDIKSIDSTFRIAQKEFNKWTEKRNPKITEFIQNLNANFFHLTDNLTVARTRKMIQGQQDGLKFPIKNKPENIFVTPRKIGNFDNFDELFNHFPPMLSGYQPAYYTITAEERKKRLEDKKKGKKSELSVLDDELQRDLFLVKMMYILMVKRLESSWCSFQSTVAKIQKHHQDALDKIDKYEETHKDVTLEDNAETVNSEIAEKLEGYSLGKKRPINLSVIDKAGNLKAYKKDLKKDITALDLLVTNLSKFEEKLKIEVKKPNNYHSEDEKLMALIERIRAKRQKGANSNNAKVIIFTVYKDTAFYLYEQLIARGFDKIAVVSGDASKTSDEPTETKLFEPILERFAPFTKLYKEKEWAFKPSTPDLSVKKQFDEWQIWMAEHDKKTYQKLQKPIDILIATDALSEGQNLQDCDMVINYDIHWNPVRVIQRMGRVDRLGSPNDQIFGINFWPSDNINAYLNLQGRIEQRMATMTLAGSEVHLEFTDTFREMAEDEQLEQKQNARMMQQMQSSWEEIDGEQTLGFDDFSLEPFRQDLSEELKAQRHRYESMPKGVYTGFVPLPDVCTQEGIIALMGYPTKPPKALSHQYKGHELIYINYQGEAVLLNQKEVLQALAKHKDENRKVPRSIDNGEPEAIKQLTNAIEAWLKSQTIEEEILEDGTVKQKMGTASLGMLNKLKSGSKAAINSLKNEGNPNEKFTKENFDLIAWFVVNK
jgi:superfamily II DNA/RNA helicase